MMNVIINRLAVKKKLLRWFLPAALLSSLLVPAGVVWAAGTLVVNPSTGLTNGQSVSVSGSGFAGGSTGTIVECNNDPNQPNSTVAGNPVPVSCGNPLSTLVTTGKDGSLASTAFTVHTGTVGPPASGNDSSGGDAAADAAKYPCPPTAAQLAAGYSCIITFGDDGGDDVSNIITFASQSQPTTTPAPTTTATTTTPSSSSAAPSSSVSTSAPKASVPLTNTGPGNTLGLFVAVVVASSLASFTYMSYRSKKTAL